MAIKRSQSKMTAATRSHLDIPLAEMQRTYQGQSSSIDSIKATIKTIFGSASLIVSLIGALQLLTKPVTVTWLPTYQLILTVIAFLYVALIIVCIAGMWPVRWQHPLNTDWDELTSTFKDMDDDDMKRMHLSAILQAIEINAPKVKRYSRLQMTALFIIPIIVLLILLLAFLPRV